MVNLICEATNFAIEKHGNQKYGRKPYHTHLFDVVGVLKRYIEWEDLDQELINAAWLHDVLEDTNTTGDELIEHFGNKTFKLVHAVTNLKGPEPKNIRMLMTYEKIRNTPGAIKLKLADRIANIEQCISHDRLGRKPGKFFLRYKTLNKEFQSSLMGRCSGESAAAYLMWDHLDALFKKGNKLYRE